MQIVEYEEKYRDAFVRLNTEWLERFYWVEPFDLYAMEHIDELISQGAMAYFAVENGEVLATCMTMRLEDDIWEICKLAAKNQYTGTGAGSSVLKAAMKYATDHNAKKLVLISCRSLKPAIHLYKKFGFKEVPYRKEYWKSDKADIEMEYTI